MICGLIGIDCLKKSPIKVCIVVKFGSNNWIVFKVTQLP